MYGLKLITPWTIFLPIFKILNLRKMPIVKNYKAEKVSTETLAHKAMDVCQEMLTIMCERTSKDGEEDSTDRILSLDIESNTMYTNLRYFGTGQQLKISKVGDSLYSAINDVMRYVMDETVKQSDCDCRFQMPKHTSFIGQIVKVLVVFSYDFQNTTLEVIARNPRHQSYLNDLSNQTGKYRFDVTSPQFLNLYYDTILRLYERGYLFDDDPELDDIRQMISRQQASSTHDINGTSISVFANSVTEHRLTTRNRVIFPYIRRLLETLKASQVTKRRVDNLIEQYLPDEEILRAFQLKYEEFLNVHNGFEINCSKTLRTS